MNMHGSPILTFAVCREVFSHFQTRIYSDGSHFKHIIFCLHCLYVLHYRDYPVCDYLREREMERERENILIYLVRLIRVSLNMYQIRQF